MTERGARPVALVTGGGIRVGRAIALGLAGAGYDLVIAYNRSQAGADEVAGLASDMGRRARTVRADLSSEAGVALVAEAARRGPAREARSGPARGQVAGAPIESAEGATPGGRSAPPQANARLDLLVNSASTFVPNDLLHVSAKEWDGQMNVNMRAPFLLVRELAGLLRASRGAVVNIVDLSALRPWTSHPPHSVSKAGLLHLTKVMAKRLAPEVRVNAVAPGNVRPPEHYTAEQVARFRRDVPLAQTGSPDDVAAAVLFLARARYVTGQVLAVDGGEGLA